MRVKLMKKHEYPQPHDEPVILSMEAACQIIEEQPDDDPPKLADSIDSKTNETFWAGRNLAMRRSARWAA